MNAFKLIKGDRIIWLTVILLFGLSLITVYSSGTFVAWSQYGGRVSSVLVKQLAMVIFGLSCMVMAHFLDYRYYSRIAQILFWLSIFLLGLTFFRGISVNDGTRWLRVPIIGLTFQSSDLAKLALIMYLARMLSKRQNEMKDFRRGFLDLIWPVFLVCALIAPSDFSTAAVLFATSILVLFIGRVYWVYIGGLAAVLLIGAFAFYSILTQVDGDKLPGRMETWKYRIEQFQDADAPVPYQVEQAHIAIARGGILPNGPGNSVQRNYLPAAYNDFIFAIIIEEYGLLGGLTVVFLYLLLLYRAILLVIRSPKAFGALLGVGLTLSIVIQAFINMGVTVGLFPVTGLTLPLVSWGGTSMLFTSIALGIVLSVSSTIEKNQGLENGAEDTSDLGLEELEPEQV